MCIDLALVPGQSVTTLLPFYRDVRRGRAPPIAPATPQPQVRPLATGSFLLQTAWWLELGTQIDKARWVCLFKDLQMPYGSACGECSLGIWRCAVSCTHWQMMEVIHACTIFFPACQGILSADAFAVQSHHAGMHGRLLLCMGI